MIYTTLYSTAIISIHKLTTKNSGLLSQTSSKRKRFKILSQLICKSAKNINFSQKKDNIIIGTNLYKNQILNKIKNSHLKLKEEQENQSRANQELEEHQ